MVSQRKIIILLILLLFGLFFWQLGLTSESYILWQVRFPRVATALLAGWGLTLCGLLMQTFFQNPLAGPYVLGLSSGASLGMMVTLVLGMSWKVGFTPSNASMIAGSLTGSLLTLLLLIVVARATRHVMMLLVFGLLISYFSNSLITILLSFSELTQLNFYFQWSVGTFDRLTLEQLPTFFLIILISSLIVWSLRKEINLLLVGLDMAHSLGANLKRVKWVILIICGVVSSLVTAYCGPVSFIGLIVPHLTRTVFKRGDLLFLLPTSFLMSSVVSLVALALSHGPQSILPLNAVMGLIGIPLIFIFLTKKREVFHV